MSSRTILSRPRTRVYDANYNIGESYYKSALDRLDRKYSGRPMTPPRQSATPSIAQEIAERHAAAFADDDLYSARERASKRITDEHIFDNRLNRQRAVDIYENGLDDETSATLSRIRKNKKVSLIDDLDLESTSNNLKTHRLLDRSEKILDSVGISDARRAGYDEDVTVKRRSLRVSAYADDGAVSTEGLTKWTPISPPEEMVGRESSASLRARQSRDRLNDIEEEMALMAEKQQAREKRLARLKALVAENDEEGDFGSEAVQAKSISISARSEKKSVHF